MRVLPALLLLPMMAVAGELTPAQRLGKALFFDASLSEPAGQSCATCHVPETAFSSADLRKGTRTPPSVSYAAFSPFLRWDRRDGSYSGGQFRDGRAADLTEQAKGPLLNPLEMNNPDGTAVCRKAMGYAKEFSDVFEEALDCSTNGFERIAEAIAAYEGSDEVNPFSSKYDAALAGRAALSAAELHGLELFRGAAKCERCHPSKVGPRGERPLFTDFGYDNIGAPKNPANPKDFVDEGLGAFLKKPSEDGKFKTPTLRNVGAAGAFMHNGALKSLEEVVEFYNRRDREPSRWAAEEPRNVNRAEMGALGLTAQDEADLVAFLKTLTDNYPVRTGSARSP